MFCLWLQAINKQSLVYSSCFIALGLLAGIVLNEVRPCGKDAGGNAGADLSTATNAAELAARCDAPVLASVGYGADSLGATAVEWLKLCARRT